MDEAERIAREVAELRHKCERGEATLHQVQIALAGIESELRHLKDETAGSTPMHRFLTVERIVFGMVGLVLIAFVTALISTVVK